jgi:hypothetical protein
MRDLLWQTVEVKPRGKSKAGRKSGAEKQALIEADLTASLAC